MKKSLGLIILLAFANFIYAQSCAFTLNYTQSNCYQAEPSQAILRLEGLDGSIKDQLSVNYVGGVVSGTPVSMNGLIVWDGALTPGSFSVGSIEDVTETCILTSTIVDLCGGGTTSTGQIQAIPINIKPETAFDCAAAIACLQPSLDTLVIVDTIAGTITVLGIPYPLYDKEVKFGSNSKGTYVTNGLDTVYSDNDTAYVSGDTTIAIVDGQIIKHCAVTCEFEEYLLSGTDTIGEVERTRFADCTEKLDTSIYVQNIEYNHVSTDSTITIVTDTQIINGVTVITNDYSVDTIREKERILACIEENKDPDISDMGITKTMPDTVPSGSTFTYDLEITNNGPTDNTGVTVTDILPTGMTFVSATCSHGMTPTASGQIVTILLGNFPTSQTTTCQITVELDGSIIDETLMNSASVAGDNVDQNSDNDNSIDSVRVAGKTSIDIALARTQSIFSAAATNTACATNNGYTTSPVGPTYYYGLRPAWTVLPAGITIVDVDYTLMWVDGNNYTFNGATNPNSCDGLLSYTAGFDMGTIGGFQANTAYQLTSIATLSDGNTLENTSCYVTGPTLNNSHFALTEYLNTVTLASVPNCTGTFNSYLFEPAQFIDIIDKEMTYNGVTYTYASGSQFANSTTLPLAQGAVIWETEETATFNNAGVYSGNSNCTSSNKGVVYVTFNY